MNKFVKNFKSFITPMMLENNGSIQKMLGLTDAPTAARIQLLEDKIETKLKDLTAENTQKDKKLEEKLKKLGLD